MKIRLLGAALATVWFLFLPRAGWAQHGGHAGGGHGGGRTASGSGGGHAAGGGAGGQTAGAQGGGHTASGHDGGQAHPAPSSGPRAGSAARENHRGDGDRDGDGDHDGGRARASRPSLVGAPRFVTSRPLLSRPYYVFRPRQRVGFGLFLGYAVPYPYSYFRPYASVYPYSYYPYISPALTYPYSPVPTYPYTTQTPTYPDTVTAAPSTADSRLPTGIGGVSFDITPGEAAVFVEGVYVGPARDFSATAPPLSLAAGRHHFELRAQGYETLAFDVDVIPGQVAPYQGTLQPAQAR
jgi:hypothetical protein